jgi:hypothetical protein
MYYKLDIPMMARKKIGAGRKPRGDFSKLESPLSVRMPKEMRRMLDAEAAKRGRSITQELLRRLDDSFKEGRRKEHDPALRGLLYVIAWIAETIAGDKYFRGGAPMGPAWRTEQPYFNAFKAAVKMLLDGLEEPPERIYPRNEEEEAALEAEVRQWTHTPDGKPIPDRRFYLGGGSPEVLAEFYLSQLRTLSKYEPHLTEEVHKEFRSAAAIHGSDRVFEDEVYNLPKATRALELPKKSKTQGGDKWRK